MSKQFFYIRKEQIGETKKPENFEGEFKSEPIFANLTDSFNLDLVIRSMQIPQGRVVLLSDGHEISEEFTKPGKVVNGSRPIKEETQRKRTYVQSEIFLLPEDSKRFIEAFDIPKMYFEQEMLPKEELLEAS